MTPKDIAEIEEIKSDNLKKFMENGPAIRDYGIYIVARDRANKKVLLGGLGCMGCGQMWSTESENDKKRAGYDDAPEKSSI